MSMYKHLEVFIYKTVVNWNPTLGQGGLEEYKG